MGTTVTWVDRRRGIASVNDLYATRIDADGTVGHPEGFAVATAISNDDASGNPVTAAPGLGNFSVGYERFVADDPYWSSRTFIRHVTPK